MGIFTIKRNHKSKNKSKESTVIEGKSKSLFHLPSIFKLSNKKKENIKNKHAKDDTLKQEQGYYFVSYQKNLAISRASSTIENENNLVQNPYNNIKTIELIQSTMNPFEEQIKSRKRKIQEVNVSRPNSLEPQTLKRIHSDSNIEIAKTEASEEKTACVSQVPDQLQGPMQPFTEVAGSSLVTCKPKHTSSMSQLNEFIVTEKGFDESVNEDSRQYLTSTNVSCINEDSRQDITSTNVSCINEDSRQDLSSSTDNSCINEKSGQDLSSTNVSFINKEDGQDLTSTNVSFINEESRQDITSTNASFYKERSTLLIESQSNIEVISDDGVKLVESVHTPSSTQATLGKDTSLTTNTLSSEIIELNSSSLSDKIKPEIIEIGGIEKEEEEEATHINERITKNSREKRKRDDSQSSRDSSSESSEAFIKEKKIRKNKKRSSKDPNLVKNHKKRMGIITRSRVPIIQDTSFVQGVKGPWKIIETTTMTAGIAASPEIIHQTFGSGALAPTTPVIIRSPSLPSLKSATVINQKLITRHQIMSDSLIEEINGIQSRGSSSSPSFDDPHSISDQGSDSDSYTMNYPNHRIVNENNSFHHSDLFARKKSNPKLFIQKNFKSIKAVLKHESRILNQNNEKRSSGMTTHHETTYPSVQSQVIATSTTTTTTTNSENINVNTTNTNTNTNVYSNITSTVNITTTTTTTNVNMNPDIPTQFNNTITTTNFTPSNTLFQDTTTTTTYHSSNTSSSTPLLSPTQDELSKESPISHSFTIIKYQLSKPSYLEDERTKIMTDFHWNSDVTMKARYHITTDYDHDQQQVSIYQIHRRRPFIRDASLQHYEESFSIEMKEEASRDQSYSVGDVSRQIPTGKKKSYNEELVKPMLDMARKRKNVQRRKQWPKKFKSNEHLGNTTQDSFSPSSNDLSVSNDNITTMATITSFDKHQGDVSVSYNQDDSFCNNYYLGLSYLNNKDPKERHHHHPHSKASHSPSFKNGVCANDIMENEHHYPTDVEEGYDHDHENDQSNRNNNNSRIIKRNEEANMIDTTFTSLEFEDTAISSVENDIASTSPPNKSTSSHDNKNHSSTLPVPQNHSTFIHPSYSSLPSPKNRSPFIPAASHQNYPRLIDVPGNSSMVKAYALKGVDTNIDEQYQDSSLLTPMTNFSTAGATTGVTAGVTTVNDTMHSIGNVVPPPTISADPSNKPIQIFTTQCTQKTSTYSYLPVELLESGENMTITNFQIHTCKDSVLSPLIPCIACSNENKWKNKSLASKFRNRFKKWMLTLTRNKKGNDKSMVYTSSTTLTVPIYFGDQMASPEDQSRHRSGDSNKKGSGASRISKRLKSATSNSSFLFPSRATQNPLPINDYTTPTIPSLHPVVETKRSSEILPIAHDINKKNSSVRIRKIVKPTPSPTPTSASLPTPLQSSKVIHASKSFQSSKSLQATKSIQSSKSLQATKSIQSSKSLQATKSIQSSKSLQIPSPTTTINTLPRSERSDLEKDALSHHGSAPEMSLKEDNELQKRISSKVSVRDGYNESIFSSPITPELKPSDINADVVDDKSLYGSNSSEISVSISTTTSSYSVPIQQFTTSTIPMRKIQSNSIDSHHRRSSTFKTLYKDICVLGLSVDRLAEKYSSNLNKKK
ncbi:hypothetical protein PIROE2DRAFT_60535 [Piromyces sp. E2]|nr:hypothetical protein PIROE2DRAFT_60535 [Piromyces sp. E2]|eukprot:OUM64621.1 hypothetical protein PIROE2DRAFT_60535 [Piromyces sp. E2]